MAGVGFADAVGSATGAMLAFICFTACIVELHRSCARCTERCAEDGDPELGRALVA